jgi:hypothetical protein
MKWEIYRRTSQFSHFMIAEGVKRAVINHLEAGLVEIKHLKVGRLEIDAD